MSKLKLAVQKSGRLHKDSMKLLKECGININNGVNRLKADADNFPMEVFFLRDDDIPQYVEDGVADIGIVGENVVLEKQKQVTEVEQLGFSKCRLSIAVGKDKVYNSSQDLEGKRIATTYPVIVKQFLDKNKIQADIHEISGSVEIAPGIGLADCICDLVSSGSTLFMNGLKEVEIILRSEAELISGGDLGTEEQQLLDKFIFRIQSVKRAQNTKYILLNAPNDKLDIICNLLPGMKSPTVLPLAENGWSSIHSVVNENEFWGVIEKLKANGAEGILVSPIEKMVL